MYTDLLVTEDNNGEKSPKCEKTECPKLQVSLCYNGGIDRLTVAIYECEGLEVRNLLMPSMNNLSIT